MSAGHVAPLGEVTLTRVRRGVPLPALHGWVGQHVNALPELRYAVLDAKGNALIDGATARFLHDCIARGFLAYA